MGRPLTGTVAQTGPSTWVASLPRRKGDRKRLTVTFHDEAAALAWLAEQADRVTNGLDARRPDATERACDKPTATEPSPLRLTAFDSPPATNPGGHLLADPSERTFTDWASKWLHEHYELLRKAGPGRAEQVERDLVNHILPVFGGPIPTDVEAGRSKLIAWVRELAGQPTESGLEQSPSKTTTLKPRTVTRLLWIIKEVLCYANLHGVPVAMVHDAGRGMVPALVARISAVSAADECPRAATYVSFELAHRIASCVHVIHQVVLWLGRVAGLRISEAYGVRVAQFFDQGDWGFLLIRRQGGRKFRVRAADGRATTTTHVENTKTSAGYRLLALPHSLTALLRVVVDAYHTDPDTGEIDFGARLVPTVRAPEGGQEGFRSALHRACKKLSLASEDDDVHVIPHDLRKGFCTDLAWNEKVSDLVKRRAAGHRSGADVFALIYTLDNRLADSMKPAAEALDAEIRESIGSLIVPTAVRPLYAAGRDRARAAHTDTLLAEAGWQIDPGAPGRVKAHEVAALLGLTSPQGARKLMQARLNATLIDGEWTVALDDVLAYRNRLAGWHLLDQVAERLGQPYQAVYQTMRRLGIAPIKEDYSRLLLLSDDDVEHIAAEHRRIDALRERSMTVAEACQTLGVTHPTIGRWVELGVLTADDETDSSGKRYITRASVEAELRRCDKTVRSTVRVDEVAEAASLSVGDVDALVAAGLLEQAAPGAVTVASLRRWATGYRPQLLTSPLWVRGEQRTDTACPTRGPR